LNSPQICEKDKSVNQPKKKFDLSTKLNPFCTTKIPLGGLNPAGFSELHQQLAAIKTGYQTT